jgi:uncharacterized membrane protein YbhN (UPF0104 family)
VESGGDGTGDSASSLGRRLTRIAAWVLGTALLIGVLDLLGVPASDWIRDLFKQVREVPAWAIVAGVGLESAQTSLAALAWFGILRAALPKAVLPYRLVLASYAAAVAMNSFLPANIGTFVMLVMFATLIAGATFTMVFSGLLVEKIPFTILNVALYLYLFITVSGSFSAKFGFLSDHTALVVFIAIGAVVLLILLTRIFKERLPELRTQLVAGGAILRSPRGALTRLGLPVLGSYVARLAIVAVFLGAYNIPVSFHNVATVTASNSISNSVSATPGGVGVTQALNATALSGEASAEDATAYSIGQQLVISAWDVIFAVILVSWVFGWSGGKALVESSYGEAKERSRELKAKRGKKRSDAEQLG